MLSKVGRQADFVYKPSMILSCLLKKKLDFEVHLAHFKLDKNDEVCEYSSNLGRESGPVHHEEAQGCEGLLLLYLQTNKILYFFNQHKII